MMVKISTAYNSPMTDMNGLADIADNHAFDGRDFGEVMRSAQAALTGTKTGGTEKLTENSDNSQKIFTETATNPEDPAVELMLGIQKSAQPAHILPANEDKIEPSYVNPVIIPDIDSVPFPDTTELAKIFTGVSLIEAENYSTIPLVDEEPKQNVSAYTYDYNPQETAKAPLSELQGYVNYTEPKTEAKAFAEPTASIEPQVINAYGTEIAVGANETANQAPEMVQAYAQNEQKPVAETDSTTEKTPILPEAAKTAVQTSEQLQPEKFAAAYGKREMRQILFGETDKGERPTGEQIEKALKFLEKTEIKSEKAWRQGNYKPEEKPEQQEKSARELFKSVKVNITEKPAEMEELQKFRDFREAKMNAREKANINADADVPVKNVKPEKPEVDGKETKYNEKPATEKPAEEKNVNQFKYPVIDIADKPMPLLRDGVRIQLPEAESARIGEEIAAKLPTKENPVRMFSMTLNPSHLGTIHIKLIFTEEGIMATILTENAKTATLLQNSFEKISLALENTESRFESFVVILDDTSVRREDRENQGNQNPEQGNQEREQPNEDESAEEDSISFAELLNAM
jgi:flagellar hook-length control protein FliK